MSETLVDVDSVTFSYGNRPVLKGITMRAYLVFEVISNPERYARARQFILDGLATGRFRPRVARTFPFEQIVDAHRYLESNEQVGKVVVTVGA